MIKINKSLVKGSFILLIAYNIYNVLNFFFHFTMVRLLEVAEYAVLASLFSIIYILAVFTESIQTVITKYSAEEKDEGKLKNILKKTFRKSLFVSLILFVIYLLIAVPLSKLLRIDYLLMLLNGIMIILAFTTPVNRGILQGRKKFNSLGINMITEAVVKFVLAIVLVLLGLSVFGAITGTIIGVGTALGLSFFSIGDILKSREKKAETGGIYSYTRPAFFVTLVILTFYSIDVIIVKIFFEDDLAGIYAIASILAKTIFFGTQPISRAMFPLSAENNNDKKRSSNVFFNALAIFCFGVIIALVIFYFSSDFIIKIFSGKEIPESASILFYLGVAISLISLSNLILLYKLSIGRVNGYYYLFIFIILEIILLSVFSNSLFQFSIAFITASAALLWASIVLVND